MESAIHRCSSICLLIAMILTAVALDVSASAPTKVTLKVVDEQGEPVVNAKAWVNFYAKQGLFGRDEVKSTNTARGGVAVISGESMSAIDYGAVKDGYYATLNRFFFERPEGSYRFGRYEPWNPILELVLKKIRNPVSLYVRNMEIDLQERFISIPGKDMKYGFDLVEADWVMPYGKGVNADFVFEFFGSAVSPRVFDFSLNLSFTNDGDGIQAISSPVRYTSDLRLPHEAPADGYKDHLNQRFARDETHYTHRDFPEDRNYFFRVRTRKNERGEIISALYGKIHGNIGFHTAGQIGFTYYLNPRENERNLEFDRAKNLATGDRAELFFKP